MIDKHRGFDESTQILRQGVAESRP